MAVRGSPCDPRGDRSGLVHGRIAGPGASVGAPARGWLCFDCLSVLRFARTSQSSRAENRWRDAVAHGAIRREVPASRQNRADRRVALHHSQVHRRGTACPLCVASPLDFHISHLDDGAYPGTIQDFRIGLRFNVTRKALLLTPFLAAVIPAIITTTRVKRQWADDSSRVRLD